MPLTDRAVRAAKPETKPRRLWDGGGLYLEVSPAGGKLWRWKYRFGGKEKRLALGCYPDVTLAQAREKRDEARKLLAQGVDPGAAKKAEKAAEAGADSFEAVAREWYEKQTTRWKPSHAKPVLQRLEAYVFPYLGHRPIAKVTAPEILQILRRIEDRPAVETAHRMRSVCSQVFRYAIATGRAERDPAADLRGALAPVVSSHHAAILEPKALGELLRAIDGYEGQPTTAWALRLAPLVFVRPGELRHAEWEEMDLDGATWTIPAAKMKASEHDHIVPLSRQAVAILREAEALTGRGRYVFPGTRTAQRPISSMTLAAALRRLGYDGKTASVHGFRATARTLLDEVLHYRPDWIEHQLAHKVRDPNGRAYNRTTFLAERREMMQRWADYLDELKADGAKVVALRKMGA